MESVIQPDNPTLHCKGHSIPISVARLLIQIKSIGSDSIETPLIKH